MSYIKETKVHELNLFLKIPLVFDTNKTQDLKNVPTKNTSQNLEGQLDQTNTLNDYSTVGSYSPKDKTNNNKGYYLTMEVKITSSNLWLSHYTDYQMELYSIISDLHDNKNKNFKEISNYLNDNGYKTPRNKVFTHKHTWSIYTKKNRSDKRFNRLYQPDIVNVGLDIINYTP